MQLFHLIRVFVMSFFRREPCRKADLWLEFTYDFEVDWFPPTRGNGAKASTPAREAARLREFRESKAKLLFGNPPRRLSVSHHEETS
jgi:hypothetical protein